MAKTQQPTAKATAKKPRTQKRKRSTATKPRTLALGLSEDNEYRCNAKAKHSGSQCRNLSVKGAKQCRFHGGATKRNRYGVFKKYRVGVVGDMVEQFANDPDLKNTADEIAIVRALIQIQLEKCQDDQGKILKAGPAFAAYAKTIGDLVEKLSRVEDGLKLRLEMPQIWQLAKEVGKIVGEEVKDPKVVERILERVASLMVVESEVAT